MKIFAQKYALALLLSLAGFFLPIADILETTGVLVLADMITGVYAALKQGQRFTSKNLGKSVTKCTWYYLAIVLAHLMENTFPTGMPVAKITAGMIATVEFKSNMENLKIITGIDFTQLLQMLINKNRGA